MAKHSHRIHEAKDRPYLGPVSIRTNPRAHGNITRVERCRCGAERRTNINGAHRETSGWDETFARVEK